VDKHVHVLCHHTRRVLFLLRLKESSPSRLGRDALWHFFPWKGCFDRTPQISELTSGQTSSSDTGANKVPYPAAFHAVLVTTKQHCKGWRETTPNKEKNVFVWPLQGGSLALRTPKIQMRGSKPNPSLCAC
jgi:hypothetical protein